MSVLPIVEPSGSQGETQKLIVFLCSLTILARPQTKGPTASPDSSEATPGCGCIPQGTRQVTLQVGSGDLLKLQLLSTLPWRKWVLSSMASVALSPTVAPVLSRSNPKSLGVSQLAEETGNCRPWPWCRAGKSASFLAEDSRTSQETQISLTLNPTGAMRQELLNERGVLCPPPQRSCPGAVLPLLSRASVFPGYTVFFSFWPSSWETQ